MKKYILLLSFILLSCSEGISEKSLIGEWVTEKGDLIIMDESILIMDGNENKYSVEDINQDLGIIKASFLTYEGIPADVQFVVKDENNLQITLFGFMTEDLLRLPDLSEISLFDELPENFANYLYNSYLNDSDKNLELTLYYYNQGLSETLKNNDEFITNYKKDNPDFNLNYTYLDLKNALYNELESYEKDDESIKTKDTVELLKFVEMIMG